MEHSEEDEQIELSLRKRSLQEIDLGEDHVLSRGEPLPGLGEPERAFIDSAIVESTPEALLEKTSEAAVPAADVEYSRVLGEERSRARENLNPSRPRSLARAAEIGGALAVETPVHGAERLDRLVPQFVAALSFSAITIARTVLCPTRRTALGPNFFDSSSCF
jgi:hypothetical protein